MDEKETTYLAAHAYLIGKEEIGWPDEDRTGWSQQQDVSGPEEEGERQQRRGCTWAHSRQSCSSSMSARSSTKSSLLPMPPPGTEMVDAAVGESERGEGEERDGGRHFRPLPRACRGDERRRKAWEIPSCVAWGGGKQPTGNGAWGEVSGRVEGAVIFGRQKWRETRKIFGCFHN